MSSPLKIDVVRNRTNRKGSEFFIELWPSQFAFIDHQMSGNKTFIKCGLKCVIPLDFILRNKRSRLFFYYLLSYLFYQGVVHMDRDINAVESIIRRLVANCAV